MTEKPPLNKIVAHLEKIRKITVLFLSDTTFLLSLSNFQEMFLGLAGKGVSTKFINMVK
jgi:hypothetical protein